MSSNLLDELLDRIEGMTPEERAETERLVMQGTADQIWFPQPGPQTDAYFSEADELFYGGQAGGGKGLIPDTPIATPFGFRPIGDLKRGDKVLARDGSHTEVIGVFPQPKQKVYRVTFADGAEIITDGPHRWNYSIAQSIWEKSGHDWKVETTEGLMERIAKGQRILIPLCEPLKFTKSYRYDMRPIDPYVLGLLLGDGYTAQYGPGAKWSFATEDPEILAALPGDWVHDMGCNYRLRGLQLPLFKMAFKRLGLEGCKADTKFIPQSYLLGTIEDRIAILQGLMDTDGTCSLDGKAYFTSTSEQLAKDVRFLVTSLGGRGTITSRIPICTNGADGPVDGKRAYTVYIRMPDNTMLFRLQRKKRFGWKVQRRGKRA